MGNSHRRNRPIRHPSHPQQYTYQPAPPQQPPQPAIEPYMAHTLPYSHVDSSLRALAGQAEGFGRHAIGGLHGPVHVVQNLNDDGPGSLRAACREKGPLWIIFQVSGTIHLRSYLNVSSYKTIDGRGQKVKLVGKGLRLKECEHVIICNLEFEGGRGDDVDGVQIKPNSKNIWIDRCTLCDYDDGLIDITRASTDITVSRCHFVRHDKTMLIGADPSHVGDRCIRVTIHHCFFDGTKQRHPRVRFGKVHLYNNYTRNWGIYAVCASVESQIFSQCCIYEAGQKKVAFKYYTEKAADREEEATGCIRSEADMFIKGTLSGLQPLPREDSVFCPGNFYEKWTVEPPSESLRQIIMHCTGWQSIQLPPDHQYSPLMESSRRPNQPIYHPLGNPDMIHSLPYSHVDSSLRALAGQAEGFGRHALGGLHGPVHVVQNLHGLDSPPFCDPGPGKIDVFHVDVDDGPGSLRAACREKGPLWIIFQVSGSIHLNSYLNVSSNKTIDGRGQKVKLVGKGLRLKECEHVIICNLEFEGGRGPDVDGVQIKPNSKHIWIDRCTLSDYDDGLIDITRASTGITVSRCHFARHDKTMLIGADPSHVGDRCIRVTIHHCFFDGTKQRHPRVRFGKVHLYNNYTRNWGIYAVCASVESQIFSQCSIYEAGQKAVAFKYYTEKAADREVEATGCIRSEADLFIKGTLSGLQPLPREDSVFHPSEFYNKWTVEPPSESLKHILMHCSGWQNVQLPPDDSYCA